MNKSEFSEILLLAEDVAFEEQYGISLEEFDSYLVGDLADPEARLRVIEAIARQADLQLIANKAGELAAGTEFDSAFSKAIDAAIQADSQGSDGLRKLIETTEDPRIRQIATAFLEDIESDRAPQVFTVFDSWRGILRSIVALPAQLISKKPRLRTAESIQLAADRVTVRLMRMDSAPMTTPNASQDEPTKASDDEATIARAPAQSTFTVVGELAPGQPIRFEVKDSVNVGRGSCDLVLPDQSVSRKHGRLYLEAGQPMVEDTGSTNGTRVNGTAVTGPTRLKQGDVVEFGDIRLAVELGGQPPAGPGDTVRR